MQNLEWQALDEMREIVERHPAIAFPWKERAEVYGFIEEVLNAHQYCQLNKARKGIVRRFLVRITGFSRAQVTRLIAQWVKARCVIAETPRRRRFPTRYTATDIALLARLDAAHEDLSGPAVKRVMEREHEVFGKTEYARLAGLSVSHIYNLRRSLSYRNYRVWVHRSSARQVKIGMQGMPDLRVQPGYLWIETSRQANPEGTVHLYAIDTFTKWQVMGCVERISERHLIPVLEAILHQFPFHIRGLQCDPDSGLLSYRETKLLNKLLVQFTTARPPWKASPGDDSIGSRHAEALQKFVTAHFNPYVNYHRPCSFANVKPALDGSRRTCRAEVYLTPYEKLLSLPNWQEYLKPGVTPLLLQRRASRVSDTESAQQMQSAKVALLSKCRDMELASQGSCMESGILQRVPFSVLSARLEGTFRTMLSSG